MKNYTIRKYDTGRIVAQGMLDEKANPASIEILEDEILEDGFTDIEADQARSILKPVGNSLARSEAMQVGAVEEAALWKMVSILWASLKPVAPKGQEKDYEDMTRRMTAVLRRQKAAMALFPPRVYPDASGTLRATLTPMTLHSRASREASARLSVTLAPMTLVANSLPVRSATVSTLLDALTLSATARAEIAASITVGLSPVTLLSHASVDVPIIPVID